MLRLHLAKSSEHTVYEAELMGITVATHLLAKGHWLAYAEIGVDSQVAINVTGLIEPVPGHYLVEVHKT
jgi:hypothetical protein